MIFGSPRITSRIFATASSTRSSSCASRLAAFIIANSGSFSFGSGSTAFGSTSITLPT